MSNDIISRVLTHSKQKGTERLVATILAHLADRNGHINPNSGLVANLANMTPRNVQLVIRQLHAAGELTPSSLGGYILSPEKSRGEIKRHQDGTITLAGSDQVIASERSPDRGKRSPDRQIRSGDRPLKDLKDSKNLNVSKIKEGGEKLKTPAAPRSTDERAGHPAILAVRELAKAYPHKATWDDVITVLGDTPDIPRLTDCFKLWVSSNSRNPLNFAWALEWYRPGILESKRGNTNATSITSSQPISNRPSAEQREQDRRLKQEREQRRRNQTQH